MTVVLDLPAGLTTRPLVPSDASAVTAVIAAEELADVGEVVIEEADIVADWQRPVARLATRADQRGRGLAQALLVDAFTTGAQHNRAIAL